MAAGNAIIGGSSALEDLSDLNQQDRERVIELLLSQERVIALLYEKTFPMTSADNSKLNYGEGGGYSHQEHLRLNVQGSTEGNGN